MNTQEQEDEAQRQLAAQPAPNPLSPVRMQIIERRYAVTPFSGGELVLVNITRSEWENF